VWNDVTANAHWIILLILVSTIAAAWKPIWSYVLCPAGRVMSWVVHFKDAWPVLETIAAEFRPNHGSSLRDAIDKLADDHDDDHQILVRQSIALENIERQLERIITDD